MPIWEYKVITSGKGGFATPAMLEKFLNDLGKDEWEIIDFRTAPDNALAFNGLARRSTQRDWLVQDAAASAAKAEADKLRAEFEAKFKGMAPAAAAEESEAMEEVAEMGREYRRPVDTSRDQDPDADDEELDEWEKLAEEEELPTFFDAIKPHMRRNQRGAGQAVGVDYLAKKWGFEDADIIGALKECGFVIPDNEDAPAAYVEYDGDLFWVNVNRRGEVWINTKEKPQPKFRVVAGQPVTVEEPEKDQGRSGSGRDDLKPAKEQSKAEAASAEPVALPEGAALIDVLKPKMRRNRHDAGSSGSTSFLSRAFKWPEADLLGALAALGLVPPAEGEEKSATIELGDHSWWLNRDQRGGVWINARPLHAPATDDAPAAKAETPATDDAPVPEHQTILLTLRPSLAATRNGVAADLVKLAEAQERSVDDLTATLVAAGLKVPEKPREKPVFVEVKGEIFWLNRNAKDEVWLNAKAARSDDGNDGPKRPRRSRGRKSASKSDAAE
ncbi:MAG: hypothetical protein ACO3DQ_06835 [Cephaloticoccus sp.]